MATNFGLRIARALHKLVNADLILDGISYPCHHAAFDRGNPMYDVGHSKKRTLASRVEMPAYAWDGSEYDIDQKIKTDARIKIISRERKSLSHNARVAEPISFDEGSISFHVTDTRR